MKKFILFFVLLVLTVINGIGQNVFYYASSGDKINLIADSTIQYIKIVDSNEVLGFLQELEQVAGISCQSDYFRCQISSRNLSEYNNICQKYSNNIAYKSAQLMFSKDSSMVWTTDVVAACVKPGLDIVSVLSSNMIHYKSLSPISASSNEFFVRLLPNSDAIDIANEMFLTGDFIYAQPTFIRQNSLQNPLFSYQWSLLNTGQYCDTSGFDICVTDAWNLTKGDTSVVVALIDGGCDLYHEDLQNNVLSGKNMVANSGNGMELGYNYHGTPCAGIIVAEDNNVGIVGVAPKCRLLPIVNTDNNGRTVDTASIKAFTYLLDSTNVSVVSCSWGNGPEIEELTNAIRRYISKGRNGKGGIVVFAAGNYNVNEVIYPGSHLSDCITVGAVCPDGTRKVDTSCVGRNWGSDYGNGLCVMAPGENIATTMTHFPSLIPFTHIGNKYVSDFFGTSAACPHVAGVAALVLSANPNLSGRKVKEIIERSCTKVRQDIYSYDSLAPHGAWDYQMGYGLVNAYQAVLMAQGCKDYPYCTTDTIRGNVSWNSPITVGDTLVIDSLSILTICDTVVFYSEACIIVRPGGKLIVNGGTITNACDGEMWQGIIVEGNANIRQAALAQGSVILNNATIENARDAICTMGSNPDSVFEHTGGIIQATNTLFRNNRRSVEFLSYENHTTGGAVMDNVSHFTRCTFTVDNDNLFAQNGTSFNNHVTMWKVRGVKFNGCAFRNETANHGGKAIYTEEAGFIARRVCPQMSNSDPCVCNAYGNDTVTRCSFSGFHTAVHSTNGHASYAVTLDNCDFSSNHIGVELAAADNARVSFCDFNLSASTSLYGLYLKNSTGYTVESNSLHSEPYSNSPSATGIRVVHSGTAENVIRKNVFRNLMYGCLAQDTNGTTLNVKPQPGLQFQCNDFQDCSYDIAVANGRIRSAQGSASAGADNTFRYAIQGSFLLSNAGSFTYWYSSTGYHAPYNTPTPGVSLMSTAAANSCASSLCGGGMVNPKGAFALSQYQAMAEEYATLVETLRGVETCHGASLQTDTPDPQDETDAPDLITRLSDLSAAMGDLARAEIRNLLNDSVPDMALLKRWYATIVEPWCTAALQQEHPTIPVSAYQLAETYSMEGDLAAAATLLASLPQQFTPDETSRNEYANYMALQQLRETVAGNWYTMTDTDIEAMQQVAEYDNGRAARMAKEILCFFHHICYEDELLWDWDGIGERALRGDGACPIATTDDGLRLHPNPATHTLTVETASPIRTLTVYDLAGRVMITMDGGDTISVMDVSSLPNGIYLLRAVTDSGVETGRFVKK